MTSGVLDNNGKEIDEKYAKILAKQERNALQQVFEGLKILRQLGLLETHRSGILQPPRQVLDGNSAP